MRMRLADVGSIHTADITFGDLTILVGPQATGKSISLQFAKMMIDTGQIQAELTRHGIDWERKWDRFFGVYFGEGMESLWRRGASRLIWNGETRDMVEYFTNNRPSKKEKFFYIPAQRVLTLRDGWPRPFTDYSSGDPFVVRQFSERLRLLMENEFSSDQTVFPKSNRLKAEYRRLLAKNVFTSFELQIEKERARKRLVLRAGEETQSLPFMAWSAGQREFVPLLLGLYWLLPAGKVQRRDDMEWVAIEEPEMGLHPKGIMTVVVLVVDLLSRGYRVCLSTHYPLILDVAWALNRIRSHRADREQVMHLLDLEPTQQMRLVAEQLLRKEVRVYFYDASDGVAHDISNLDPASEDAAEAGWGGLTDFSARIAENVASLAAGEKGG